MNTTTEEGKLYMDSEPQKLFAELQHRKVNRVCKESGELFEINQTKYGEIWFPEIHYCDSVLERFAKEEKEQLAIEKNARVAEQKSLWIKENIPPYYQDQLDRDKSLDWGAVEKALSHSKQSMVLKGETRRGKTRVLYEIVKKNAHLTPYIQTAERLARILGSCLSQSPRLHEKNIKMICRQKLLCIDDLGKENVTQRTQTDLFEIINHRLEQNLPTIITTNFDSEGLAKRFTDQDLAIPLIARIAEFKVVHFR